MYNLLIASFPDQVTSTSLDKRSFATSELIYCLNYNENWSGATKPNSI